MTEKHMTSKFAGTCRVCGKLIPAGSSIRWAKDLGARHESCIPVEIPADAVRIRGGSGYGCHGWSVGEVVRNRADAVAKGEPEYLYVLTAQRRYVREDGLSFGVGDDSGYLYSATCRAATDDEAKPLRDRIAAADATNQAKADLTAIIVSIRKPENNPGLDHGRHHVLDGERMDVRKQDLYGGGDWFVVTPDWIWYVQNNGSDGADWRDNNVHTGGAGGIGWRVPFSTDLANRIRTLIATISR